MRAYIPSEVSDADLRVRLRAAISQERGAKAEFLVYIADFDARRLYAEDGYPTLLDYCIDELHLTYDCALKRIQAARSARDFPQLLPALGDGRLTLTGICLLASRLTPENAEELINAAAHLRTSSLQRMLATRWSRAPSRKVTPIPSVSVGVHAVQHGDEVNQSSFELTPPSLSAPAEDYRFQFTASKDVHEKFRHAQELLGHVVRSGDVAKVFEHALDALIGKLEKRKFAHKSKRPSRRRRHVPEHVKREAWHRDGGQCTFVANTGHRCAARRRLEFDHILPVARGGESTVENLRIRCRAHNQYEAEQAFGRDFMKKKREHYDDLLAGLRGLGVRLEQARQAAEHGAALQGATLEERMREALKLLRPRTAQPSAAHG